MSASTACTTRYLCGFKLRVICECEHEGRPFPSFCSTGPLTSLLYLFFSKTAETPLRLVVHCSWRSRDILADFVHTLKHQIQPGCEDAGRPNLFRETKFSGGNGDMTKLNFPCSADHEQDWQPYRLMPKLLPGLHDDRRGLAPKQHWNHCAVQNGGDSCGCLQHTWPDSLGEEHGDHVRADFAYAGNTDTNMISNTSGK